MDLGVPAAADSIQILKEVYWLLWLFVAHAGPHQQTVDGKTNLLFTMRMVWVNQADDSPGPSVLAGAQQLQGNKVCGSLWLHKKLEIYKHMAIYCSICYYNQSVNYTSSPQ